MKSLDRQPNLISEIRGAIQELSEQGKCQSASAMIRRFISQASQFVCLSSWKARFLVPPLAAPMLAFSFGIASSTVIIDVDPNDACHDDEVQKVLDRPDLTSVGQGIEILLPNNEVLRFCRGIRINKRVILRGNGSAIHASGDALNEVLIDVSGQDAAFSSIEDIWIQHGSAAASDTGVGMRINADYVRIDNFRVADANIGVIVDDATGVRIRDGNVGGASDVQTCSTGLRSTGRTTGMLVEATRIASCAIAFDEQAKNQANNTYFANLSDAGTSTDFRVTSRSNQSTFVANYIEGVLTDGKFESASSSILTVGGNQIGAYPKGERVGYNRSKLIFGDRIGDDTVTVHVPYAPAGAALTWSHSADQTPEGDDTYWYLGYFGSGPNGRWAITSPQARGAVPYAWTANGHADGPGRYILGEGAEICTAAGDEDGDGDVNCDDSDCAEDAACQ